MFEWKGTVIRYRINDEPNHIRQAKSEYTFDIDVPNPIHWTQSDDSYFGYAIASGYFNGSNLQKMLYVASAPQVNGEGQGEVYIFDIIEGGETIKIYYKFTSHRMGEYFGYALAADDFNGDGLYDLAICAPLYSRSNVDDNGAVYIYQNLGNSAAGKLNFVLQTKLLSDYESGGRFGSSIARLGDVNQDGYKGTSEDLTFICSIKKN